MKIDKPAVAGTLESSDCQVMVESGNGSIDIELNSSVINQYGDQIKSVLLMVLKKHNIDNIKVIINDKGALDCTIKARVECALSRAANKQESFAWR